MSHTSTTLEDCGEPEQNAEEHISEDELTRITSFYQRDEEIMGRTNDSAVFVHRIK